MWKGKTLARISAGFLVVAAAACGGGDDTTEVPGGEAATPATTTPAATPGAAPGGDPTAAPATGATTPAPAAGAGGAAGGGELVAQGQQAYATSVCVSCHGPNAQGTPLAPALNDGEWLWVDPAAGDVQTQIATIIKTGVSQPKDPAHVAPMLPYGGVPMDDAQVDAISAYIVSISGG
jgi:mono/diheme cytochrome c family protein